MSPFTAQEIYELLGRRRGKSGGMPSLVEAFPHDAQLLSRLKCTNAHLQKLAERYRVLTRSISRIEASGDREAYAYLKRLKRQRLLLLDEIALIIEQAEGIAPATPGRTLAKTGTMELPV